MKQRLTEVTERLNSILADVMGWESWDPKDHDNWDAMELNVRRIAKLLDVELTEPERNDDDTDD